MRQVKRITSVLLVLLLLASFSFSALAADSRQARDHVDYYDDIEEWERTLTPKGTYIDEEGNEVIDYGVMTSILRADMSCPTHGIHRMRSNFAPHGRQHYCGDWKYRCLDCAWNASLAQITHNFVVPGQPCTRCGWDY